MTDNPKTWGEMTPEEKGALLLAHYEGKSIHVYVPGDSWIPVPKPAWHDLYAYRVKPEPKRETVRLSGQVYLDGQWAFGTEDKGDTHRITFDTIDGEPDCSSIRMEKFK